MSTAISIAAGALCGLLLAATLGWGEQKLAARPRQPRPVSPQFDIHRDFRGVPYVRARVSGVE